MTAETLKDQTVLLGWPIGFHKQTELAEALKKASEEKANTMLGVWCAETGFALLVEIYRGNAILWHCTGPCSKDQAKRWLDGFAIRDSDHPSRMN